MTKVSSKTENALWRYYNGNDSTWRSYFFKGLERSKPEFFNKIKTIYSKMKLQLQLVGKSEMTLDTVCVASDNQLNTLRIDFAFDRVEGLQPIFEVLHPNDAVKSYLAWQSENDYKNDMQLLIPFQFIRSYCIFELSLWERLKGVLPAANR